MPLLLEEVDVLQSQFRLDAGSWLEVQNQETSWILPLNDILDQKQRLQALKQIKHLLGTANLSVASSMLVKRISFAILIPLALFSLYQKRLVTPIWNVALVTRCDTNSLWIPNVAMDLSEVKTIDPIQRSQDRTELFRWIFQSHISRWIRAIRSTVKISEVTLWENIYVYVQWMYRKILGEIQSPKKKKLIEEDYFVLITDAKLPLTLEGRNPFVAFSQTSMNQLETKRQTCCLAYLTSSRPRHCKVCPVSCKIRISNY